MKTIVFEDFKDLELNEFPYDRAHTALGEYHHRRYQGTYGAWYDPIPLHQWRSMDGSWLVTSDGKERFLEQNRGNHTVTDPHLQMGTDGAAGQNGRILRLHSPDGDIRIQRF